MRNSAVLPSKINDHCATSESRRRLNEALQATAKNQPRLCANTVRRSVPHSAELESR